MHTSRSSLPPLNALRVFQVAARQNSFALAAQQLNLTPAAVAYQIKQLEDYLEIALFERQARGVNLTRAGLDYWQSTSPLLEQLSAETARLIGHYGSSEATINLYTLHAVAEKWLLPRLAHYSNPQGSAINLVAVTRIGTEEVQKADVCISFQAAPECEWLAEELMQETVTPLCSPAYLQAHPELQQGKGLAEHVWLYDTDWEQDWDIWLAAHRQGQPKSRRRLNFSLYSLVVNAAVNGMGIAMGREQLVQAELSAGKLVRLSEQSAALREAYYLIARPQGLQREAVRRVFEWLREQGERRSSEHLIS